MNRWLGFEDLKSFRTALQIAMKEAGATADFYVTASERRQVVEAAARHLSGVDYVYYDLVLEGENDSLSTIETITAETAEKLETLRHLDVLMNANPQVIFVVATHYQEIPAVSDWLATRGAVLPHVRIIEKPKVDAAPEALCEWARELIQNPYGRPAVSPESSRLSIAALYMWRPLDKEREEVRAALKSAGYALPWDAETDPTDFGRTLVQRSRTADYVWYELFDANGTIDTVALKALEIAAECCPWTDFWIPIGQPAKSLPPSIDFYPHVRVLALADSRSRSREVRRGDRVSLLSDAIVRSANIAGERFASTYGDRFFLGTSSLIREIQRTITSSVDHRLTLVTGPTGSGKEGAWQAILRASARVGPGMPYYVHDAGQHAETLQSSAALGSIEGMATGVKDAPGALQLARDGTLIIEEGQSMTIAAWMPWKRLLEDPSLRQAGVPRRQSTSRRPPRGESAADAPVTTSEPSARSAPTFVGEAVFDINFIVLVNEPLDELVRKARMPQDIVGRLRKGKIVALPSLRERREDLPYIIRYFLHREMRRRRIWLSLTDEAQRFLETHDWPLNFRDVEGVVTRIADAAPANGRIDRDLAERSTKDWHGRERDQADAGSLSTVNTKPSEGGIADFVARAFVEEWSASQSFANVAGRLNISPDDLTQLLDKFTEVRSWVTHVLARATGWTEGRVATQVLAQPRSRRTAAGRLSFYMNFGNDQSMTKWFLGRVRAARPTQDGHPDQRQYSAVARNIFATAMRAEGDAQAETYSKLDVNDDRSPEQEAPF